MQYKVIYVSGNSREVQLLYIFACCTHTCSRMCSTTKLTSTTSMSQA